MAVFFKREALWSLLGLLLVGPLNLFLMAWPEVQPCSQDIAEQMSLSVQNFQAPFWMETSILGLTGSLSLVAVFFVLKQNSLKMAFLIPSVLLSMGFCHELPIFNLMRFPYRWHLTTLVVLCALLAPLIKNRMWIGWLIFVEQMLLSPLSPMLPYSKTTVPDLYDSVDRPLLHIPGPYAQPAGQRNSSRRRAAEFLLAQVQHKQPLLNRGDFNGLESNSDNWWLSWDPLSDHPPTQITRAQLTENTLILVHKGWLGKRTEDLETQLKLLGASEMGRDRLRSLWIVPKRSK